MATGIEQLEGGCRHPDIVEEASKESMPASDAPAFTPTTALGPPDVSLPPAGDMPEPPLQEVHEHPLSDPASHAQPAP